jgi:hypothetical protein
MEEGSMFHIEYNPTAFKRGVTEDDIRFAFNAILFDHPFAGLGDKNLLIGLDRRLNPIEILYNENEDRTITVFHAMRCRKAWLKFVNLEENHEKND